MYINIFAVKEITETHKALYLGTRNITVNKNEKKYLYERLSMKKYII